MKAWFLAFALFLVACTSVEQISTTPTSQNEPVSAALTEHEGNVTVNGNPVSDGMELKEGDVIKTENDSEAEVILFESSRVRVWDNTTLIVQRLTRGNARSVQLRERAGEIWARVLRISGIREYEVSTPDTVASVRGTGFWVAFKNETTGIGVTDGKVLVQRLENGTITGEKTLEKEQQIIVDPQMTITPLKHDEFIDENLQKDAVFIERVRERVGNETFDAAMNFSS